MRLTAVILIASLMQVSAMTFGQRITLNKTNTPLSSVLKEIRKQSGFDFYYDDKTIPEDQKITISITAATLAETLNTAFKGLNLKYDIEGTIVTIRKDKGFFGGLIDRFQFADIRGLVSDEKGNPLPGATVKVKGNKIVAVTDQMGRFTISGVTTGDLLIISYIGYAEKQITVGKETNLSVTLELATSELNEVTIANTGYQKIPKERATGSFKIIDREQLDRPATTIAQRLIGTTAGLAAISDANGNVTFRIRGLSTLSPSADPLIVLDGFPLQGATFNEINPNNVESITVLKDAAAASIWGSRAANGVIVITTKSGKRGVPFTADISSFTRIGSKIDLNYANPLASSSEMVSYEQLSFGKWNNSKNSGTLAQLTATYPQASSALGEYALGRITLQQRDAELARLSGLDNRQQIRDLILDNPVTNQVNLNLTGGTARTTQALSSLFETNTTAFKGTDNKRIMINYRMDANVFKWLDFNMGLMVQYQKANNNGFNIGDIKSWSPYDMILNDDGSQVNKFPRGYYMPSLELLVQKDKFPYDFYYNPLRERDARDFTSENLNSRVQAGLTAKIIKGLSLSSSIQYEYNNTFNRNLNLEDSYSVRNSVNDAISWNGTPTGAVTLNLPKGAQLGQNRSKLVAYNFRNQVDFNRTFNTKHSIDFVAFTEIRQSVNQTFTNPTTYGYNDATLTVGAFPNGPGGSGARAITNWRGRNTTFSYINSFGYTTARYYSLGANASYTFNSKYSLSGSYRTDASNFIAATDAARYAPFWSVGGLWQVGKEKFLENESWLDKLALRVTYGVNGNEDRSTSPYALLRLSTSPDVNTGESSASISSYGNPLLRWEKTYTFNEGIDFSMFKGKLFGSIELYQKKGKDLLADINIPAVNGVGSQKLNNVEMNNTGIDIDLGTSLKINRNIHWRGNVTFAYNNNKIIKLFRAQYTAANLVNTLTPSEGYVEGLNANTLWSYIYGGFVNGDPAYKGPDNTLINFGQNVTTDARSWMQNSGVTVAPYTLGMVNSFDIYNFNLSTTVTGKFGHVFRRLGFNYPTQSGLSNPFLPNARLSDVLNGDPTKIVTLPTNNTDPTYGAWGAQTGSLDYNVANASTIRLQEISLSYNLKPQFIQKLGISALRLYAQGNNLLTITDNKYDEDPEYPMGAFNLGYKATSRIIFGFKLQL